MVQPVKLPVAVVIEAIDKFSAPWRKIQQRFQKTFAPIGQVKNALDGLGESLGFSKLGKALGGVKEKMAGVWEGLATMARRIATIGGAAVGAVLGIAEAFGLAGEHSLKMARKLGVSVEWIQEITYAGKQWGIESDAIESSLTRMAKGLGEGARGGGKLLDAFQRLNIPLRDGSGHLRSLEELLPVVADRLNELDDDGKRTALTMEIFGKGGAEMTPMLREGSDGIGMMIQEVQRLGAVMSEKGAQGAKDFVDAQKRVQGALTGLLYAAAGPLMPALTHLANQLTTFLVDHKPEIEAFATDFAQKLPGAIDRLATSFSQMYESAKPTLEFFGKLIEWIGPLNALLIVLGVYVAGPFVASLVSLGAALISLTIAAWPLITAIYAMGAALLATPVGWILLGIAAIVAAAILLWKNWDKVAAFFVGIWEWIKNTFAAGAKFIWEKMPWMLGAAGLIIKHWGAIKEFFSGLWDHVRVVFGKIVDFVSAKVDAITSMLPDWLTGKGGAALQSGSAGAGVAPALQRVSASPPGAAGAGGQTKVLVSFDNAPRGTRASAESDSGDIDLSMGYAMVGTGG